MRWGHALVLLLALEVGACESFDSAGVPASGFLNPAIGAAYLPLEGPAYIVLEGRGAGVVIGANIAATNAHNGNLVPDDAIIGESRNYDLLFFHTTRSTALPRAAPVSGERVMAYGQGGDGELRMAEGVVTALDAPVLARCVTCTIQHAFVFEAAAGKGFSGGPVVDAANGRLLGIVFGFRDEGAKRLMYAYDMARVDQELAQVTGAAGSREMTRKRPDSLAESGPKVLLKGRISR